MDKVVVNSRSIVRSNFVSGVIYDNIVDVTMEDRILHQPKKLLEIIIKKGIWKKYPDICDRCIDRMCELKQYNEIAKMCKIFIHKSDN